MMSEEIIGHGHILKHFEVRDVDLPHIASDLDKLVEYMACKYLELAERDVTTYLQRQLFRSEPLEDEVCHLTYDMWKDLRQSILSREYGSVYLPIKGK